MCEHSFYYKTNLETLSDEDLEKSLTSVKARIEYNWEKYLNVADLTKLLNNHQVEINRRKLNALPFNPGPRLNLEEIREKAAT